MNKNVLILLLFFFSVNTQAQKLKKEDRQLVSHLQQHVKFLSDDKLEGRRTGTAGEKLASDYISAEFKKIGLIPKGTSDYLQAFEVNEGKQIGSSTFFQHQWKQT